MHMQSGEEAGLVVNDKTHVALCVCHVSRKNFVIMRTNNIEKILSDTTANTIRLQVEIHNNGKCVFAFSKANDLVSLPQTFQAGKGKWIGAKLGLYIIKPIINAPAGHADFNYFHFL
jgi:hypothetical protein